MDAAPPVLLVSYSPFNHHVYVNERKFFIVAIVAAVVVEKDDVIVINHENYISDSNRFLSKLRPRR